MDRPKEGIAMHPIILAYLAEARSQEARRAALPRYQPTNRVPRPKVKPATRRPRLVGVLRRRPVMP